jgi:hypothetical protein
VKKRAKKFRLATIDSETDPARRYRKMEPFSWGFFDGTEYKGFWGLDCTNQLISFLRDYEEPLCIYAHNGGKFDFLFMREHMTGDMSIIASRIVRVGFLDCHQLRDSYALIPSPLDALESAKYGGKRKLLVNPNDPKSGTDWNKFEPENRERYRSAIEEYQRYDCLVLYDAIEKFRAEFGDNLTMAQAAMKQCHLAMAPYIGRSKVHVPLSPVVDANLRPFYFGGRVQCFQKGALSFEASSNKQWHVFDVRSMYPSVMKDIKHPIGNFDVKKDITDKTDFVYFYGWNKNFLPVRTKQGLKFDQKWGDFYCSIHELKAGLAMKRIGIHKIKHTQQSDEKISFAPFIDKFFSQRMRAKADGNIVMTLFYKLVMNSAYGKFAMSPERYKDYELIPLVNGQIDKSQFPSDDENAGDDYKWHVFEVIGNSYAIVARKAVRRDTNGNLLSMTGNFLNVGTAASITGAARAKLAAGIFESTNVTYCDTDSVICEAGSLDMLSNLDAKTLGTWEHEASGDALYILGKKMYALYNGDECVKYACKGVNLSPDAIRDACLGKYTDENPLIWRNDFPTQSIGGNVRWMQRRVRMTA